MDWNSTEGRELLQEAIPTGFVQGMGVETLGLWICLGNLWMAPGRSAFCSVDPEEWDEEFAELVGAGDLLPAPDWRKEATWQHLKRSLAEALGWPHYLNLSWWELWPGGWCLHGKNLPGVLTAQEQSSANFDVKTSEVELALVRALIRTNRGKQAEKVRWYCDEHQWEEVRPRGEMHHGCPTCGGYFCEPAPRS